MPSASAGTAAPARKKVAKAVAPPVHNFGGEAVGPFKKGIIQQEWDGYKLVRIYTPEDMAILAQNGGGCSAAHFFWTGMADPPSEYFFVMVNPKGNVGTILFCKDAEWWGRKHPQDAEYVRLCRLGLIKTYELEDQRRGYYGYGYDGELTSDYYDRNWRPRQAHPWRGSASLEADRYEEQYKNLKATYESVKKDAIATHGPLSREHPDKARLDDLNKRVAKLKGVWERAVLSARVSSGTTFEFDGRELFIQEVAGRGVDYNGANTRYTDKLAMWIEGRAT